MPNATKILNKTFKWNVKSIDIERTSLVDSAPSVKAYFDVMGPAGGKASMTELIVDLQNRLSGTTTTIPTIKNVIFNPPATIILWSDNTKTVVKCQEGDKYDPEKGLAMAIVKKIFGNTGKYCEVFKKWVPEVESEYPNMILDLKKVDSDWIPTAQDKPTKDGVYLVYDKFTDSVYVYEYCPTCDMDVSYWRNYVTHWMPAPAAPVTKKGE